MININEIFEHRFTFGSFMNARRDLYRRAEHYIPCWDLKPDLSNFWQYVIDNNPHYLENIKIVYNRFLNDEDAIKECYNSGFSLEWIVDEYFFYFKETGNETNWEWHPLPSQLWIQFNLENAIFEAEFFNENDETYSKRSLDTKADSFHLNNNNNI